MLSKIFEGHGLSSTSKLTNTGSIDDKKEEIIRMEKAGGVEMKGKVQGRRFRKVEYLFYSKL